MWDLPVERYSAVVVGAAFSAVAARNGVQLLVAQLDALALRERDELLAGLARSRLLDQLGGKILEVHVLPPIVCVRVAVYSTFQSPVLPPESADNRVSLTTVPLCPDCSRAVRRRHGASGRASRSRDVRMRFRGTPIAPHAVARAHDRSRGLRLRPFRNCRRRLPAHLSIDTCVKILMVL